MKTLKTTGKIILFIVLLGVMLFFSNIIFKAKWIDTTFPTTTAINGFYDEPKDSIDIVYLGSSQMMSGISPIEIWEETGLTGYTCGSTKLSIPSTYLYLKEAIKNQHPSTVIMDVSRIFKDYDNILYEEDSRRSLDYMPLSADKLEVADVLMEGDEKQTLISYIFPLVRYHSRWTDLKEEDFTYIFSDKHMSTKGQSLDFTVSRFALPDGFLSDVEEDDGYAIDEESIYYFEKIVDTCKANDISLILIKIPCYSWNKSKSEFAADLASSYGVPYIDYNQKDMMREIDFVATQDFQDEGDHLNTFGAAKVSRHLGNYILKNCEKAHEKPTSVIDKWAEDAAYYNLMLEDAKLDSCPNLIDYLELLKNPNYIVAVAARFDAAYCITPEVIAKMRELGLAANLEGKYKASYSAIIESGLAVTEGIDLNNEVCLYYENDDINIDIYTISRGSESGNLSSILINGREYSGDQTGLTFAVYDTRIGEVVSSKRFNTHSKKYVNGTELGESIMRNYLDLLDNENYVAFIATKGTLTQKNYDDLSQWINNSSSYTMERNDNQGEVTALICDGGEIVDFKQGKDISLSYSNKNIQIEVIIHDIRTNISEYASIKVNGTGKSRNENGINVVVIDKRDGSIVSRKVF